MSRYSLYFLLAAAACFVASSALATPIRILLATPGEQSAPTETADFDSLDDENVHVVARMTQGTGVDSGVNPLGETSSNGGNRNANVFTSSQPQMGGVALALGSVLGDDDRSRSRSGRVAIGAAEAETTSNTGGGGDPEPPAHMPEPGAALLFAVGAWITGRHFRR